MLRGQRAQGAKKDGDAFSPSPHSTEHPDGCEPEREAHQAEARRCSEPLLPLTGFLDYTGHGPNRTGNGEYLRLGGTFYTIYWSLAQL